MTDTPMPDRDALATDGARAPMTLDGVFTLLMQAERACRKAGWTGLSPLPDEQRQFALDVESSRFAEARALIKRLSKADRDALASAEASADPRVAEPVRLPISFVMTGGSKPDWTFSAGNMTFDQCFRLTKLALDMIVEDRRAALITRSAPDGQ